MTDFWRNALLPLGGVALLATVLAALFGSLTGLALLAAGLLLLLLLHLRQLASFVRWLESAEVRSVPEGRGLLWGDVFAALNRVVKSHGQTEQKLSSALLHLEQATAALPEGVVILNQSDRIEWCNPLACEHFGLNSKQDLGQQITYLARQPEFVQFLAQNIVNEPRVLRGIRQESLALSVKLIPYGDNKRLLISRDITQLERVETMRRDFVANVSHELRTPLTVVNGFVETLLDMDDRNNEMAARGLQLMGDQTQRMTHLVDDLLTLSRLESDSAAMAETEVDIPALLNTILQDGLRVSGGNHQISLGKVSDDKLLGNSADLYSAFSNLVNNAIRYTPTGGSIELRWEGRNGEAVFSVKDSGIGIAPQHIPRLTERFYRVDRSRSRETGGTGLGLAIVKHIAVHHQARLEISSEEGKGSVFSLVFPPKRRMIAG